MSTEDDEGSPEDYEARDNAVLDQHLAQLSEHFDTVQIFVTRNHPREDTAVAVSRSKGNWFTRIGQVREWMVKAEERMRIEVRNESDQD